jgi:hypothetical protein
MKENEPIPLNQRLIIYITERKELEIPTVRYGKRLGLEIESTDSIPEAINIPKTYTPTQIRQIFVHAGIYDDQLIRRPIGPADGIELAKWLAEKRYPVALVTGGNPARKEYQDAGVPVISILALSDYLEKLAKGGNPT